MTMSESTNSNLALDPVAKARRGLLVYFVVLLIGSGACEGLLIATREPITDHLLLVLANMWMPTLASVVARVALREGIVDVSFRFGPARRIFPALAKAWGYPLVVGAVAYGMAWLTGLASFTAPSMRDVGLAAAPAWVRFAALLGMTASIGVPLAAISAAGEEIGWRGFMVTRLVDAKVPRPALVSGLVWGVWHVPLIVTGQYASGPHPLLSAFLFLVSIVAAGYLAAHLRCTSGSVWPAIAFHSAWNSIIQGAFDGATAGASSARTTSIWIGESGILVVAVSVVVAALFVRGPWGMRRWPASPIVVPVVRP
ncbi:MAG: amino terminal protease family protein [Labilithrix sp.]|nr:amino terminal protease family protein [Labilithrix sp.]